MALTGTSVIEINTSALAADTNGGAFDSTLAGSTGVDYTFGAGAQVVNVSVSGNGTATLTITSGSVSSTVLGNAINVPGQGVWIITAYTSTTLTVNTTNGTPGTFASTASFIGGPWKTLDQWASLYATQGNNQVVNLKYGTYVPASALVFENGNNSLVLLGYYQTRGDLSSGVNPQYRPTIQASSSIGSSYLMTAGNGNNFGTVQNVILDGNGYATPLLQGGTYYNNRYQNTSASYPAEGAFDLESEYYNLSASSLYVGNTHLFGCLIYKCGQFYINGSALHRCLIIAGLTNGVYAGGPSEISSCTIFGCSGSAIATNPQYGVVSNNLIYGNTSPSSLSTGGASPDAILINNCATDQPISGGIQRGIVTLTADPFANSGAAITYLRDALAAFALNNVAGGGALCRGAGTPQYLDIGAVQSQAGGGGGVPRIVVPRRIW